MHHRRSFRGSRQICCTCWQTSDSGISILLPPHPGQRQPAIDIQAASSTFQSRPLCAFWSGAGRKFPRTDRRFPREEQRQTFRRDDGRFPREVQKQTFQKDDRRALLAPQGRAVPLREIICFRCNEPGHVASRCPKEVVHLISSPGKTQAPAQQHSQQ